MDDVACLEMICADFIVVLAPCIRPYSSIWAYHIGPVSSVWEIEPIIFGHYNISMAHSHCYPCRYNLFHFEFEFFEGAGFNAWIHHWELISIRRSRLNNGLAEQRDIFLFVGLGKGVGGTLFPYIQFVDRCLQVLNNVIEFFMGFLHYLQNVFVVPFIILV